MNLLLQQPVEPLGRRQPLLLRGLLADLELELCAFGLEPELGSGDHARASCRLGRPRPRGRRDLHALGPCILHQQELLLLLHDALLELQMPVLQLLPLLCQVDHAATLADPTIIGAREPKRFDLVGVRDDDLLRLNRAVIPEELEDPAQPALRRLVLLGRLALALSIGTLAGVLGLLPPLPEQALLLEPLHFLPVLLEHLLLRLPLPIAVPVVLVVLVLQHILQLVRQVIALLTPLVIAGVLVGAAAGACRWLLHNGF
mmetsp:Transcript_4809/g.14581  ORF Transcript_4809/g.14581 Transcript_4809/m.14581 type:complete len:258 (-) Transcript_4809:2091-2864(-)